MTVPPVRFAPGLMGVPRLGVGSLPISPFPGFAGPLRTGACNCACTPFQAENRLPTGGLARQVDSPVLICRCGGGVVMLGWRRPGPDCVGCVANAQFGVRAGSASPSIRWGTGRCLVGLYFHRVGHDRHRGTIV